MTRVLVIGGYGHFGSRIVRRLLPETDLQLIIAGRSIERAQAFVEGLGAAGRAIEVREIDVRDGLAGHLARTRADIVVHTSGPFQGQTYGVAESCIQAGCHYVDLADGRDFVASIRELDGAAKARAVTVVSGASSVPAFTAALLDAYGREFSVVERAEYGIATAQRTNPGSATMGAVLSYAGRSFETRVDGDWRKIYGWQGLHVRKLRDVGRRFFANCDVPDLALFPERYPDLRTIRFYAGLEVPLAQFGIWLLSWAVRFRLVRSLRPMTPVLQRGARVLDLFGSDTSGFFMEMTGRDENADPKQLMFHLAARSGDGTFIPCVPAIILVRRLARGEIETRGAFPCIGMIDLDAYLQELAGLDIHWSVERR